MEEENFQQQQDELCALEAIYADHFEKYKFPSFASNRRLTVSSFRITIPNDQDRSDLEITVHYNKQYPSSCYPKFSVYAEWLTDEQIADIEETLMEQYVANQGDVCVYNWVEWLRENVQPQALSSPRPKMEEKEMLQEEDVLEKPKGHGAPEPLPVKEFLEGAGKNTFIRPMGCPDVFTDEAFTDRKSTFQAHCAEVHSEKEVKLVLEYLYSNTRIQRATHNMYAYRIYNEAHDSWTQDNDDDGETAAGSRMLHLLNMMDVKNVLVVVSRWWGGILLGPDRFKHINNATRNVLEKCGFVNEEHSKKKKKG